MIRRVPQPPTDTPTIDVEAIRLAMFADPGVKAVENDVRLYRTGTGEMEVAATIALASPDVDLRVIQAIIAKVLQEQFGIRKVDLHIKDPGPSPGHPPESRGPLRKN